MNDRQQALQRVSEVLGRDDDIELGVVFGSVAAERPRADSDIDVAVLTRSPLNVERKRALTASLAAVTGRPVDLIDLSTAGVALTSVVLRTGKRVVCRAPRIWADLVARNLIDAADFLPYRDRILTERRQAWTR